MLVFPQLISGASALYPLMKRIANRTVVNVLDDGHMDTFGDPDAAITGWELRAMGITRAEWDAIEALFQQTSGMWQSFTFLDPTGNLLLESENFGASAWTNGPLIQVTTGISDPFGSMRATTATNTGSVAAEIQQILTVPGNFRYCLSVWARSASPAAITLVIANATRTVGLNSQWQRIYLAGHPGQASATSVSFGIELAPSVSVDLFGMQAEVQLAPSDYKPTGQRGGVYPKARFASDRLTVTAQGTDVYDAVIRIVNTEN